MYFVKYKGINLIIHFNMNVIFSSVIIVALIILLIINPDSVLGILQSGTTDAINLSVKLLATYAVWMSIMKIMEKCGLNGGIAKFFKPIIKKMFKGESEKTYEYISINFASNLLGLGGAATPSGISAITEMNKDYTRATKNMVKFLVISSTSIQLVPTTVLSLMSMAGSSNPSVIILPTLISTISSSVIGIILVDVFVK